MWTDGIENLFSSSVVFITVDFLSLFFPIFVVLIYFFYFRFRPASPFCVLLTDTPRILSTRRSICGSIESRGMTVTKYTWRTKKSTEIEVMTDDRDECEHNSDRCSNFPTPNMTYKLCLRLRDYLASFQHRLAPTTPTPHRVYCVYARECRRPEMPMETMNLYTWRRMPLTEDSGKNEQKHLAFRHNILCHG